MRPALLRDSLAAAPQQPATAFWRAVEVEHVAASDALPVSGRGLDVGCGDGAVAALVTRRLGADWLLVGAEPDPHEAALARARGTYARVHVAAGDAVPEADGSFDFALSNSVLEHVVAVEPILAEIARLLRPGGRLVATAPGPRFHELLRGPSALGRLATGAAQRDGYLDALDRRLAHRRYWAEDDWRRALATAGLELSWTSSYLTGAELRRWEALSNATGGLLARVGRRAPIDAQRSLGLRGGTFARVAGRPARLLAPLLSAGLGGDSGQGACLLVVADRPGVAT